MMASGYDVTAPADIDRRYLCPICLLIIRDAVQTRCGHRFCESCLAVLQASRPLQFLSCPVDKIKFLPSQVFPDVATRREILSLSVECKNTEVGCTWAGELRDFEPHLAVCEHEEVTCPNETCDVRCRRRDLDHHKTECPAREVQCGYCDASVLFSALKIHEESCPKIPVSCPKCARAGILREDLAVHIDPAAGDCPMVEIACSFASVGCQFKAERHKVEEHIAGLEGVQGHLSLAITMMEASRLEMDVMRRMMGQVVTRTERIQPTLENSQRRLGQISRELRDRNVTGRLQWKVRLRGYSRSRNTTYCSPAFYTGCPGYKVQLTLNMEGFREGRETYVSMALGLLPGDYDENLIFPFDATCAVTLFDQTEHAAQHDNLEQMIVLRQVPRNRRAGTSAGADSPHKRTITKYMLRRDMIGQTSKYMRNNCLHIEVTVLHAVFPALDCCSATLKPHQSLLPVSAPTATMAPAVAICPACNTAPSTPQRSRVVMRSHNYHRFSN